MKLLDRIKRFVKGTDQAAAATNPNIGTFYWTPDGWQRVEVCDGSETIGRFTLRADGDWVKVPQVDDVPEEIKQTWCEAGNQSRAAR